MSAKDKTAGTAYIAGGGYLAYKGLEHGLPRALGIRTEYHVTSKINAKLIKNAGNILDPKFGGKNGWGAKISCDAFVKNSENFVHITGFHPDSNHLMNLKETFVKLPKKLSEQIMNFLRPLYRNTQCFMYKTVGNSANGKNISGAFTSNRKEMVHNLLDVFKNNTFHNKTKRFCIPGIDSYFTKEFIADCDDIALKSSKPIKAYSNRFSAMIGGLKQFGLKGIKENKSRVVAGLLLVAASVTSACLLIKKGIKCFKNNNQGNAHKNDKPKSLQSKSDLAET